MRLNSRPFIKRISSPFFLNESYVINASVVELSINELIEALVSNSFGKIGNSDGSRIHRKLIGYKNSV